jgi:drug/metabolite transporter (DMT)-like permease
MFGVDATRWGIGYAFPWLNDHGPWSGWRRVVFHVDATLLLNAWPIGLATLAWVVFLRRRPWPPLLVGAIVLISLVLGYPWPFRGEALARSQAAIEGAALAATAVAVISWTRRRAAPRPEHAATLLVALLDLAYFSGPLVLPAPWVEWAKGDTIALTLWSVLLAMHAWSLLDDFLMLPEPPRRVDLR